MTVEEAKDELLDQVESYAENHGADQYSTRPLLNVRAKIDQLIKVVRDEEYNLHEGIVPGKGGLLT